MKATPPARSAPTGPAARSPAPQALNSPAHEEVPSRIRGKNELNMFGSDYIADVLRDLDVPFAALIPGASYRGLHDSVVNYLGNEAPRLLLCLHEEHAVAIAHGYAKVTEKPLIAIVHSNVGLMHATMAVFNAWCDRVPLLLLGATGPIDAAKRRPWIDWIHTSQDQGALIRNYVKWDDQPGSLEAARESLLRAYQVTATAPSAPVYVNLDAEIQEAPASTPPRDRDVSRYAPLPGPAVPPNDLDRIAAVLKAAKRPVVLCGRVSRKLDAWQERVALAEALNAKVATDLRLGAAFPTAHRLHFSAPSMLPAEELFEELRAADVIVSLGWLDLGGLFKLAFPNAEASATVITATQDHMLHNGWSKDHFALPSVDIAVQTAPDVLVSAICAKLGINAAPFAGGPGARAPGRDEPGTADGPMSVDDMARVLRAATEGSDVCLIRLPLSWSGGSWHFEHPLDYLGGDGGGGIGSGPGMAVGAALALMGSGRLPVAVLGDGDFVMGCSAVWTAVRYGIPLLVVVANNRSFFNDELHQERMAIARDRPVENRWIGQRIDGPALDLAKLAEAQGAAGYGPARSGAELRRLLEDAIQTVRQGGVALVDAHVLPGYAKSTAAAVRGQAQG